MNGFVYEIIINMKHRETGCSENDTSNIDWISFYNTHMDWISFYNIHMDWISFYNLNIEWISLYDINM